MPVLYWGLVVDSLTHEVTLDRKFVAQNDDAAKVKIGVLTGLDDLEDVDIILQRLGPVTQKPTRRRKPADDEGE